MSAGAPFLLALVAAMGVYVFLPTPPQSCTIVMYSMRGCPFCVTAKRRLRAAGLRFEEIEYVRGVGKPARMPNGKRAESFPTMWVDGKNRGGEDRMREWMGQCRRR